MNKSQAKRSFLVKQVNVNGIKFQTKKETESENALNKLQIFKQKFETTNKQKTKAKVNGMLLIQDFSSLNPSDWREESQAGCRLWINHSTGEVSPFCPWEESQTNSSAQTKDNPVNEEGTGSLVYDNDDFESLMALLDSNGAKK